MAAPAQYRDFSVTQTQGDTAEEILVIVSKPSSSEAYLISQIYLAPLDHNPKQNKIHLSLHCMIFNLEIAEFLFESLQQYYRA